MPVADLPKEMYLSEHAVELSPGLADRGTGTTRWPVERTLRMSVPPRIYSSSWFGPVVDRLQESMRLDQGWDSYGGSPIAVSAVQDAISFLASTLDRDSVAPAVVPMSDGGLQLLWHRAGIDIEVTFAADGAELYTRDLETGGEMEWPTLTEAARTHFALLTQRLAS